MVNNSLALRSEASFRHAQMERKRPNPTCGHGRYQRVRSAALLMVQWDCDRIGLSSNASLIDL